MTPMLTGPSSPFRSPARGPAPAPQTVITDTATTAALDRTVRILGPMSVATAGHRSGLFLARSGQGRDDPARPRVGRGMSSEFERVAERGAQCIARLAGQVLEAEDDVRRADLVRQIARVTEQILAATDDDPRADLVRQWAAAGHRL